MYQWYAEIFLRRIFLAMTAMPRPFLNLSHTILFSCIVKSYLDFLAFLFIL